MNNRDVKAFRASEHGTQGGQNSQAQSLLWNTNSYQMRGESVVAVMAMGHVARSEGSKIFSNLMSPRKIKKIPYININFMFDLHWVY